MSDQSYCEVCGETYDSDNLITCVHCNREFCYRCGDSGAARCKRCQPDVESIPSTPQS